MYQAEANRCPLQLVASIGISDKRNALPFEGTLVIRDEVKGHVRDLQQQLWVFEKSSPCIARAQVDELLGVRPTAVFEGNQRTPREPVDKRPRVRGSDSPGAFPPNNNEQRNTHPFIQAVRKTTTSGGNRRQAAFVGQPPGRR